MPRKPGWKDIPISGETHQKLKELADLKDEDIQILADNLLQTALNTEMVPQDG